MYFEMFMQMKKQLLQLDKWLEAATAYADAKKFDANNFLGVRLVVDQFPFVRQVQAACDAAKLGASRLGAKTAPVNKDDEATMDQLRERIKSTVGFLESFTASDFEKAAVASITQPRWEGKTMTGADYFLEHVVPNFYFHLTTAFALLRSSGLGIGKRDYLGALTQSPPKA